TLLPTSTVEIAVAVDKLSQPVIAISNIVRPAVLAAVSSCLVLTLGNNTIGELELPFTVTLHVCSVTSPWKLIVLSDAEACSVVAMAVVAKSQVVIFILMIHYLKNMTAHFNICHTGGASP